MVITRCQSTTNNRTARMDMEKYSDNDSVVSLPTFNSRNYNVEINGEQMIKHERDHKRIRLEQRFNNMNRQIGEPTFVIRTLTEKISSSNREVQRSRAPSNSDSFSTKSDVSFRIVVRTSAGNEA